jgi:hypothetical protein
MCQTPQIFRDTESKEVLRYDVHKKTLKDVFVSEKQSQNESFHPPEGLVFSPDRKLCVTSFRRDVNDIDKILVLADPRCTDKSIGLFLGKIPLDDVSNDPKAAHEN